MLRLASLDLRLQNQDLVDLAVPRVLLSPKQDLSDDDGEGQADGSTRICSLVCSQLVCRLGRPDGSTRSPTG